VLVLSTFCVASVTVSNNKPYTIATIKNEAGESFATLSYGQSVNIPTEKIFIIQSKKVEDRTPDTDRNRYRVLPYNLTPGTGKSQLNKRLKEQGYNMPETPPAVRQKNMLERNGYRIPASMER